MSRPASLMLSDVSSGPIDTPILRSISLELGFDGVTAIAGPSGAGKTSLLRLLNRLADPTHGRVEFAGRDLTAWDPVDLRRRVAMVFQRPPIFSGSVLDNLCVAQSGLTDDAAADALRRVGLEPGLLHRSARDLSGGEAQRMCFARALLTKPDILLADEPTASLDGVARQTIEELARRLAADGMPIIWVSHDIGQLRRLADHVVVLAGGGVLATGRLAELDRHHDQRVRELVGAE